MEKKTTVISPEALQRQEGFCGRVREYWQAQGITPVAFVETYGCQQNEADSERIRGMLRAMRLRPDGRPLRARIWSSSTPAPSASTPSSGCSATWARWCIPSAATREQKIFLCGCMMGQPARGRARSARVLSAMWTACSPPTICGSSRSCCWRRADDRQARFLRGRLCRRHCRGPARQCARMSSRPGSPSCTAATISAPTASCPMCAAASARRRPEDVSCRRCRALIAAGL